MSITFASLPATTDNEYFQDVWSRFFGHFIESAREKAGLSIKQAAFLACMEAEQWAAIEVGRWLPTTRQQFRFMAIALELDWGTMAGIVLMCRQGWGIQ